MKSQPIIHHINVIHSSFSGKYYHSIIQKLLKEIIDLKAADSKIGYKEIAKNPKILDIFKILNDWVDGKISKDGESMNKQYLKDHLKPFISDIIADPKCNDGEGNFKLTKDQKEKFAYHLFEYYEQDVECFSDKDFLNHVSLLIQDTTNVLCKLNFSNYTKDLLVQYFEENMKIMLEEADEENFLNKIESSNMVPRHYKDNGEAYWTGGAA